ncbi:UNVERIFIED_CONTAM: hypothetical protein Slati_1147100 [Sesamum latifolium]|uniref:Uncharacterized protein n=1 Tax=Sesamum latifolium TaxID=2727402 RepID=A0AAW2XC44_9LAMI
MDIVGPFPIAQGQRKFLPVAVDYFSKWVEDEPLAKITKNEVLKFLWRNIIRRYGLPRVIFTMVVSLGLENPRLVVDLGIQQVSLQ